MSASKPFIKRILFLGVVPVFCSTLLSIIGFLWIQNHQLHENQGHYIKLVENSLHKNLTHPNVVSILDSLQPLLNIDPISHISVLGSDKISIAERGLPINKSTFLKLRLDRDNKSLLNFNDEKAIAIPFSHQNSHYWLIVAMKKSALMQSTYYIYLLLSILSLLSLGLTLAFSQRLHSSIVAPLKNMINELRFTLNTRKQSEISYSKNTPYSDLAETINELISMQHSTQDEMQQYVEQSTKELRETLETVEIQNIELDIARKNALQASRAKSEFLANTSHELRTPLNGILGFTSLLLKTGLSNQQKDYLSTIEQSAQGLLTVINDILDFSKLETGQLTLEYKAIFVRELIEEVFSIYAPQAHEKNIRLLSIVNHNVPRNLLGDPQRLKQVLTNLISNAIKFSARGNIIVRSNAIGEMDNQVEIKFTVSDNGIGLTDEQQENLFIAFTKVDSSDSRFQGGTGLGLAIAKGLVDRMHGEIGVESESRIGSTFWFTIRLGLDKQRISQSPLMNSLYGVRALVYDANPAGRTEVTHLLTSWGVNYLEESLFNNISASLSLHSDQQIDLLILDAYTEDNNFDKTQLLQGIRKINSNSRNPIILLAPPAIQRVIQDDIIGLNSIVVQRPISHNQLHQSICNLLSIAEPIKIHERLPSGIQNINTNQTIRVLVVDDNPANRKLACEFLRPLGTITSSAESGFEALKLVDKHQFDLILMDVQMPGLNGMETTQQIRQKEKGARTPIVALTAHAVAEQKTKLLLSGMDDFLSKPVSEEDLINMINRWVKHRDSDSPFDQNEISPGNSFSLSPFQGKTEEQENSTRLDIFNWAESMSLAKSKPELAADMLRMLIDSLDETELALKTHLENAEFELLFETNHKFHGGCCYCGVPAVRVASKRLEESLYHKNFSLATPLTLDVINEIKSLKSWSEEHDIEALFIDPND